MGKLKIPGDGKQAWTPSRVFGWAAGEIPVRQGSKRFGDEASDGGSVGTRMVKTLKSTDWHEPLRVLAVASRVSDGFTVRGSLWLQRSGQRSLRRCRVFSSPPPGGG